MTITRTVAARDGRRHERRLLERHRRDADVEARDELCRRFMPLAIGLARRFRHTGEPVDDLIQVACIGLLKAIDRFDVDRGVAFTSFATPTILGELKRHLRDHTWAVTPPRSLQERAVALQGRVERLAQELGRSPSVREIADDLGWSSEDVLEASEAGRAYRADSLDRRLTPGDESEPVAVLEAHGREDDRLELVMSRDAIAETWQRLPRVQRQVVALRFTEDLTQGEIGGRIGASQMQVSRLLRKALGELSSVA